MTTQKFSADFSIKSKEDTLISNKKDHTIAKLKSQLHEARLRARDYKDMNDKFAALRTQFDLLVQSNHDSHNQCETNLLAVTDFKSDVQTEFRVVLEQKKFQESLNAQLLG